MKRARETDVDGTIHHCNAVRIFVQGSGNLDLTLLGLVDENNEADEQALTPIVMSNTQRRSQTALANFKQENFSLEVSIDAISEYFYINSITVFTREVETGYPQ